MLMKTHQLKRLHSVNRLAPNLPLLVSNDLTESYSCHARPINLDSTVGAQMLQESTTWIFGT